MSQPAPPALSFFKFIYLVKLHLNINKLITHYLYEPIVYLWTDIYEQIFMYKVYKPELVRLKGAKDKLGQSVASTETSLKYFLSPSLSTEIN